MILSKAILLLFVAYGDSFRPQLGLLGRVADRPLFMKEHERLELWKSISNLERTAVDKLKNEKNTDEALRLFLKSTSLKSTDPFLKLAAEYNIAEIENDKTLIERLFSELKQVGLPPHLAAVVGKKGNSEPSKLNLLNDDDIATMDQYSDVVTDHIRIRASSFYDHENSRPGKGRYIFYYKMGIINEGNENVQVVNRVWEIQKYNGETETVKGASSLTQQTVLTPGAILAYQSSIPFRMYPPIGKKVLAAMSGTIGLVRGSSGQQSINAKVGKIHFILPAHGKELAYVGDVEADERAEYEQWRGKLFDGSNSSSSSGGSGDDSSDGGGGGSQQQRRPTDDGDHDEEEDDDDDGPDGDEEFQRLRNKFLGRDEEDNRKFSF